MGNVKYNDPVFQEIKVKSANNRKIIFEGEVNDEEFLKTWYYLDKLIAQDKLTRKKQPITIYLHTPGGSILAGASLLGKIKYMQDKLGYTIIGEVGGYACSMGFQILQQCRIRKCNSYSQLMFHQPSSGMYSDLQDMERDLELTKRLWEQMRDLVVSRTNITKDMANEWKDRRIDKYFTIDELKQLNIVDEIIDL